MIKLVPSKKVVLSIVPYICTILYFVIAVLSIIGITSLFNKNKYGAILICIAFVIVLLLVVINYSFSWYKSADIIKNNKYIEYNVTNVVGVLGKNITKYHILKCDKYKWSGKDIIVIGDIEVFEPMMKPKHIKKIKINDATLEVAELLIKFFNI